MGVHDVHRPRLLETDIPARLDRLPWSAWHWRVVHAFGITRSGSRARGHALGITRSGSRARDHALDGLEVTLVGAVANVLGKPELAVPAEGRYLEEIAALDDAIT